jgi:transcriptional regulator with XRE-family HTH domain
MNERQYGRRAVEVGGIGRNVATNLRRLRDARSLSTRDLSALLAKAGRPIPASGITRIEKGERRVDVDDFAALAAALNVEPGHLLADPASLVIEVRIASGGEGR